MKSLTVKPISRVIPLSLSVILVFAAVGQDNPDTERLLKEARIQYEEGAYHRAAALYLNIINADPADEEASTGYMYCLLALDEKDTLEFLERAVDGPVGLSGTGAVVLAELRLRRGRSEDTADLLGGAGGGEAALVRGKIDLARRDSDPAVKEFKSARIYGLPEAEYYLGEALIASDRCSEAIAYLQGFTADYPYVAGGHAALGEAYQRSGRYESALAEYDRALVLDATCVRALCNKGWLHYEDGDYGAAIKCYNEVLLNDPWDADALYNLALVYEKVDRSVARNKWIQFIEMYDGRSGEEIRVERAKKKIRDA